MLLSKTMTKFQLFALLTSAGKADVIMPDGRRGVLSSIQRKDGWGRSFNLTIDLGSYYSWEQQQVVGNLKNLHVRTID